MGVWISVQDPAFNFGGHILRDWIDGLHGGSSFNFLRSQYTIFHISCVILYTCRQCTRVPISVLGFFPIVVAVVVQPLSYVPLFPTPWIQHIRLPYPSVSPGVCSNSCPLNRWCHWFFYSSHHNMSEVVHCIPFWILSEDAASWLGAWSLLVGTYLWCLEQAWPGLGMSMWKVR